MSTRILTDQAYPHGLSQKGVAYSKHSVVKQLLTQIKFLS